MKKIMVRKIFPYDPTLGGKYSKYDGYKMITLRESDPGISKVLRIKIQEEVDEIFHSTLLRGQESALYFQNMLDNKSTPLQYLDEVIFDLGELVSKDEYITGGSNNVRQKFIAAFIKDELSEKREEIKRRIVKLISFLDDLENGNYLLISHSFFMKVLQIYLVDESLFEDPKRIRLHFDHELKTFNFGDGFDFNL